MLVTADRFGSGEARADGSTVTGRAFVDFNSNGIRNAGDNLAEATDSGAPGVVVKAYDSAGTLVGTTTSGSDGSYTLTVAGAASDQLRVEFSTPSGYQPSFVATGSTTENNSSVQFVSAGATGVDYAVTKPDDYCQSNPDMVTCVAPTFSYGPLGPNDRGALRFPSSMTKLRTNEGDLSVSPPGWPAVEPYPAPTYASKEQDVVGGQAYLGSIFGIGADRDQNVYFGTYVKRHVPYGASGATNTIYRRYLGSGGPADVSAFITLPGTLPAHSAQNPAGVSGFPDYAADGRRNVSPGQQGYSNVYSQVGRVGLGDVDVSQDGKTLYAVDMNQSAPLLYTVPLQGQGSGVTPGTPTSVAIPRPTPYDGSTCLGTWHPMGLGLRDGRVLVGGVCGAESTVGGTIAGMPAACMPSTFDAPNCDVATSPYGQLIDGRTVARGYVLEYSGGSWSTVASIPFNQKRAVRGTVAAERYSPVSTVSGVWRAWNESAPYQDSYLDSSEAEAGAGPQPLISNIEVADNGSLAVGLRDRYQDMRGDYGTISYEATTDALAGSPFSGGDLIRLCPDGSRYQVESGGNCGSEIGANNVSQVNSAGLGYGGSTFYFNGFASNTPNIVHAMTALGATASIPGSSAVWSTVYDATMYGQQGIRALGYCKPGSTDCGPDNGGIGSQVAALDWGTAYGFGWDKGSGLADLEALCDKAPVQIGNRLWVDANKDGIQDPGEKVLAGVTVRLYDSGGTLVGTAITDSEGRYYFSSTLDKPAPGDGTSQGGGLKPDADFVVRLDNPGDYASGGPLAGYSLTVRDAGSDSAINSKAVAAGSGAFGSGSFPEMRISSRRPGENNHTFDAGFVEGAAPGPSPDPGAVGAPRLSVAVGGCIHARGTRTVRLTVRNPNKAAMGSRRVSFTVPKGFRVVGGSRGYSVRKRTVTWKSGTIAAGKTEKLYVKLKATGRAGTRSRLVVSASGAVDGTAVKAARRAWAQVCAKRRPGFTG